VDYGDIHSPRYDPECMQLLYIFLKDLNPDITVDHGDLLNGKSISIHPKDPNATPTIKQELKVTSEVIYKITEATENAEHHWVKGNHDWWFIRHLWKYPELVGLLNIDDELGIKALNWHTYDYGDSFDYKGFVFTHGNKVSQNSGATANKMLNGFNRSGINGHTHRGGSSFKSDYSSHAQGWWEGGCLCDYTLSIEWFNNPNPNWQHAVNVIKFFNDDEFHVDQIIIPKHKFIFYQDKYYTL
jgi:hypothetical protein